MHSDESTSPSLLMAVRSRDNHEGWRRFLATYEPLLTRWLIARGYSRSRIPDVLSEVYLKLVQHLPTFVYDSDKSFRSWLKTVAENTAIDLQKRACNRLEKPVDFAADLDWRAAIESYEQRLLDEFAESIDARLAAAQAIVEQVRSRVSDSTWQAFILTEIEELSCAEAAAKLNISESSVYVARFRVRKHLRIEATNLDTKRAENY